MRIWLTVLGKKWNRTNLVTPFYTIIQNNYFVGVQNYTNMLSSRKKPNYSVCTNYWFVAYWYFDIGIPIYICSANFLQFNIFNCQFHMPIFESWMYQSTVRNTQSVSLNRKSSNNKQFNNLFFNFS